MLAESYQAGAAAAAAEGGWASSAASIAAAAGAFSRSSSGSSLADPLEALDALLEATGAPESGPHGGGPREGRGPLVDIDQLLIHLLQETQSPAPYWGAAHGRGAGGGHLEASGAAALLASAGPLYEYGSGAGLLVPPSRSGLSSSGFGAGRSPAVSALRSSPTSNPPESSPSSAIHWFMQLSQRSQRSGTECTVYSGARGGAVPAEPGFPAGTPLPGGGQTASGLSSLGGLADAFSDGGLSQYIRVHRPDMHTPMDFDQDEGQDELAEDSASIFDVVSDGPAAAAEDEARDVLGDDASSFSYDSSPRSGSPRRSRAARETSEVLGPMLLRLTEDSLIEESATASVRRVLQLGAVLTGHRLSDQEIRALPKVRFEAAEQQQCAICLEAYREGEVLTALRCQHFFHVQCLTDWMRRATQCPLCRHECGGDNPEE